MIDRRAAFTLIEITVVAAIMMILMALGISFFRQSQGTTTKITETLTFAMEARKASQAIREALLTGTEVVKPIEGFTLPYAIVKDLTNEIKVLYFERTGSGEPVLYQLVEYTDSFKGAHDPDGRKVLFDNVKTGAFTALGAGMVIAQITLYDPTQKKDLSFFVEAALKNIGSSPDE